MRRRAPQGVKPGAEALRRHLKQRPDDGRAWLALTSLLLDQAPGPELMNAASQGLRCLPDDHQAWTLAARVQQRMRGTEAALLWLDQATARNPGHPGPHLALSRLRLNRFQLVEALEAANRAVELSGGAAEALVARGDANLQGTHWEEALAAYRQAAKAGGNDASLMHQIGCCYFGMDELDAAEAHFRKALARDPRQLKSRFLLALSRLKRLELAQSEALLAEIATAPGDDAQIRLKAATAAVVLREHRRLKIPLRNALDSGELEELQAALGRTPEALLQRDERTIERFQHLASIFRDHSFDIELDADDSEPGQRELLEAETLCTAEIGSEALAALFREISVADAAAGEAERSLLDAWHTVRQRTDFDPALLSEASGEAWLRYWHARLLRNVPEAHPGQFKAVDAAIPGKPKIAPEFVTTLCREVLGRLLPTVPTGWARALFLYACVRVLQPFSDGNSRLARFLMNAELEADGRPAVVIPVSSSGAMNSGLDELLFRGRVEPLLEAVTGAHAEAARQLQQFGRTR